MDIESTMQFILDQQTQFSSDIARINLVQQRTNEILASLAECQNQTEQNILEVSQTLLDVANAQEHTNENSRHACRTASHNRRRHATSGRSSKQN